MELRRLGDEFEVMDEEGKSLLLEITSRGDISVCNLHFTDVPTIPEELSKNQDCRSVN